MVLLNEVFLEMWKGDVACSAIIVLLKTLLILIPAGAIASRLAAECMFRAYALLRLLIGLAHGHNHGRA